MGTLLSKVDNFGKEVPRINIKGETAINTPVGGCLTILTILTTLVYALIKLDMLYERSNPTISGATLVDYTE